MNINNLKVVFAVTASMLFAGISAYAQGSVRQIPGEIMWVDLQVGQLQIQTDNSPSGSVTKFRIDRDATRVKSDPDKEFLQIFDLHPGQDVTVDVATGQEGKIVQRITTEPRVFANFLEAYGEIGTIDFSNSSFTLVGRQRINEKEVSDINYFSFDPKKIIVMQSHRRQVDQVVMRPGNVVRVEFVLMDARRMVRSVTIYSSEDVNTTVVTTPVQNNDDLVGPRGPTGPAGITGEQGPIGFTGPSGVVLAGDRGAEGPAGPMGERGLTGPRGPSGELARGPMGEAGPSGPQGAQGAMGQTGQQGNSLNGFAGPMGAAGPQGERGPVGDAGAIGPTTFGPIGPAGHAGATGEQGVAGDTGSQGSTTSGVAGLAGPSGDMGPVGETGATGDQGVAGVVGHWVFYKEFNFLADDMALGPLDMQKISDMAAYMKDNPSLAIDIDGTAANHENQDLNNRRALSIQQALINDGASSDKVSMGEIGSSKFRRDGRIAIFFKTS